MSEANKAIVRRYYEEVLNQRRPQVFDELADPGFTSYLANGKGIGIEIYKQAIAGSLAARPDLHVTLEDQIAEGEAVVTRWSATGTPQVPFAGAQPNGRPSASRPSTSTACGRASCSSTGKPSTCTRSHRAEDQRGLPWKSRRTSISFQG